MPLSLAVESSFAPALNTHPELEKLKKVEDTESYGWHVQFLTSNHIGVALSSSVRRHSCHYVQY